MFHGWEGKNESKYFPPMALMRDRKIVDYFKKALKDEDPDIVVSDFYSTFCTQAADELGYPVIIHQPGPMGMCQFMMDSKTPTGVRYTSWCGLFCICPVFMDNIAY